jgi:hypothetical protein
LVLETGGPGSLCGLSLWLWMAIWSLSLLIFFLLCVSLCPAFLFVKYNTHIGLEPTLMTMLHCKNPVSKYSHILRYWCLRFQREFLSVLGHEPSRSKCGGACGFLRVRQGTTSAQEVFMMKLGLRFKYWLFHLISKKFSHPPDSLA